MGQIIQLMTVFFKIGLFSIGGGYAIIPLIQEEVVNQRGWVLQKTFTDIITISQMTPGPLAVNTSTFIGIWVAGIFGAIVATLGCVISGIVISVLLYRFFQKKKESSCVLEILNGLKASSLGLIISAAMTILLLAFTGSSEMSSVGRIDWPAIVIFLGVFAALRKWKVNPIGMILLSGVIGAIVYC